VILDSLIPMTSCLPRTFFPSLALFVSLTLANGVLAADAPTQASPTPVPSFPLSTYASFGSVLSQSGHFSELGWSDAQMNAFLEGFRAAYQGKPNAPDEATQQLAAEVSRRIGEIASAPAPAPQQAPQARPSGVPQAFTAADRKVQLARYFNDMGKRLGLQISGDGLGYNVQPGRNGIRPRLGDTIVFTCAAMGPDGTTKLPQLSSDKIRVKFEGMLPGLMEGLQMMTVGSQAVFVLPPSLSYGDGEWPDGVPRGSPLVYSITLHDVVSAGAPP
jgi:FKBP-type peptidyl-prolyl cis-trans isomerase FkpA